MFYILKENISNWITTHTCGMTKSYKNNIVYTRKQQQQQPFLLIHNHNIFFTNILNTDSQ